MAENQRSFRPFAVGPFWVHPCHVGDGMPAGLLPLRIDAGLAFGTGTHATTRGCLEMLATLDPAETANAVDVGCGSGILAIAMAKLWQRPVLGGDNDAEAVEVAIENAGLNGVGATLPLRHLGRPRRAGTGARAPYDLIVANILAGPLMDLSESFAAATRPGGRVLLSGLLVEQAGLILVDLRAPRLRLRAPHRSRDRRRLVAHARPAQGLTAQQRKGPAIRRPFYALRLRYATEAQAAARSDSVGARFSVRRDHAVAGVSVVELRHDALGRLADREGDVATAEAEVGQFAVAHAQELGFGGPQLEVGLEPRRRG